MWERLNKLIKPNGAIVLFGSEPFSSALRMSNIKNYKYDWKWRKENGTGFLNAKKQPLKCIEDIMVFYKNQCTYNPQMRYGFKYYKTISDKTTENYNSFKQVATESNGERYPLNFLEFKRDKNRIHPTQKPVKLMEYLIKTYTNENETVLDFTAGSFSTGVAAVNTNRDFIGIELDKKYFDIGVKRIDIANKNYQPELF